MSGIYIVAVTAIVFGFVYSVVKMGIEYSERIERMKHGYPLKDGTVKSGKNADFTDYRGINENNGYNDQQRQQ